MSLKLNAKFAELVLLFRRELAFDGTQKKLMAHLMKVSVWKKGINRASLPVVDVSPGGMSVIAGGGVGPTTPVVGMLPAKIEVDKAHTSTTAIASLFMDVAPLRLRNAKKT